MEEIWSPVPGNPIYQASSQGRIRSLPRWVKNPNGYALKTGRILTPSQGTTDRLKVSIYEEDGSKTSRSVHSIVCSAFHGPAPEDKPWALHRNGDHRDNRPENLYWGTPKENAQDTLRHGKNFLARKTQCIYGHEYTADNTYYRPDDGTRQCKTCIRARGKKRSEVRRLNLTYDSMKKTENMLGGPESSKSGARLSTKGD